MTIRVDCPGCGRVYHVAEELAGMEANCPGCGGLLVVPADRPQPEVQLVGGGAEDDTAANLESPKRGAADAIPTGQLLTSAPGGESVGTEAGDAGASEWPGELELQDRAPQVEEQPEHPKAKAPRFGASRARRKATKRRATDAAAERQRELASKLAGCSVFVGLMGLLMGVTVARDDPRALWFGLAFFTWGLATVVLNEGARRGWRWAGPAAGLLRLGLAAAALLVFLVTKDAQKGLILAMPAILGFRLLSLVPSGEEDAET